MLQTDSQNYTSAGTIIIRVRDNGAGIAQENLANMFGEGMQINANKLQSGQGSGLGLHIAKGIVNLHNGTIAVHSDGIGLGTTFTVELPLLTSVENLLMGFSPSSAVNSDSQQSYAIDIEVESEKIIALCNEPSAECLDSTATTKIISDGAVNKSLLSRDIVEATKIPKLPRFRNMLIVDDSKPTRRMVCRLLSNAGYNCVEKDDGRQCVEYMLENISAPEEERINVILMDFEMPVLNGPDATSELRALGIHIPIVGITGNALPSDTAFFMNAGANHVLTKPLDVNALVEFLFEFDSEKDK